MAASVLATADRAAAGALSPTAMADGSQDEKPSCCFRTVNYGREITAGTSMTAGVGALAAGVAGFVLANYFVGVLGAVAGVISLGTGVCFWLTIPSKEIEENLHTYMNEVDKLKSDNTALTTQLGQLAAQRDNLQTTIGQIQTQSANFKQQVGTGVGQLQSEDAKFQALKGQYDALLQQYGTYRDSLATTSHLLTVMTDRYDSLQKQLPNVQAAVAKADASGQKLHGDVELATGAGTQAGTVAQQIAVSVAQLQAMGQSLQTTILPAMQQQSSTHSDIATFIDQLKQEDAKFRQLAEQTATASSREEQDQQGIDAAIKKLNDISVKQAAIEDGLGQLADLNRQLAASGNTPVQPSQASRMSSAFSSCCGRSAQAT